MRITMTISRILSQAALAAALMAKSIEAVDALPPSEDPWYTAPKGYERTAAPGEILRIRHAPNNLTAVLGENVTSVYNILYRTTDSFDEPSWAVTTLLIPTHPRPDNTTSPDRLLSYQIPYNTLNLDYSPSYALESLYSSAFIDILPALAQGWYINIPDFEGPLAAFSVSVESAHATLDSVRAAVHTITQRNSNSNSNANNTRIALWGYSGGTFASEVAAELQPSYAPEINLVGVAVGGLLPNVTDALETINGKPYAGLNVLTTLGLAARYPSVRDYLDNTLIPSGVYNKTTFLSARKLTTNEAFALFANQSIALYFSTGSTWLDAQALQPAIARNWVMGVHGTPRVPLFFYKAIHDEMSPVRDTDVLAEEYCAAGVNLLYERNTLGNHLEEDYYGDGRAFAWLEAVLEGRYASEYSAVGCTIRNVTVSSVVEL